MHDRGLTLDRIARRIVLDRHVAGYLLRKEIMPAMPKDENLYRSDTSESGGIHCIPGRWVTASIQTYDCRSISSVLGKGQPDLNKRIIG